MGRRDHSAVGEVWFRYKHSRLQFFQFRYNANVTQKLGLALGLAALTGVAAQIRVPLPFTPVPITLQTFVVLLAGISLGARWGGASQAIYAGLGGMGVPWFTGMSGGVAALLGPTGGYIVGFVAAAILVGYVTDRYIPIRRFHTLLGLLFVANFVVIYGFGLPWLYAWFSMVNGSSPSIMQLLTMGLFPFVAGDIVKILAAAAIGRAIVPTEAYGPEEDLAWMKT